MEGGKIRECWLKLLLGLRIPLLPRAPTNPTNNHDESLVLMHTLRPSRPYHCTSGTALARARHQAAQ